MLLVTQVIVAERAFPVHEKTIKPVHLGGVAGGQKYIVHNILFKFALDQQSTSSSSMFLLLLRLLSSHVSIVPCGDTWMYGGANRDDAKV
jgi:hypothetical protein